MKVAIVSAFRNAVHHIPRYFEQMALLEDRLGHCGHSLQLVLGYGDSKDKTNEMLHESSLSSLNPILVDVSHGGHHFGSIVHPARFKQLAHVGNKLWGSLPEDAAVVGLVESDLIWQPYVISGIALTVGEGQVVAPMVYHRDGRFYDTWAFRSNGVNFRNDPPFHPALGKSTFLEMDSVGSVLFMENKLANKLYWPEEDVVVGLCGQARGLGAKIWCNTSLAVYHP